MAKDQSKDVLTMLGSDAVIQGNLTCQGGVAIYGKIYGDLTTAGSARVAKGGEVHGNIQADDANISGLVEGNVTAQNRAVLGHEANLKGDLIYRSLIIEEGAQFQGHCVPQEANTDNNTDMNDFTNLESQE
ncbi:MAG: polymer-forming cytoskeletal protein [Candidatus Neomarinimicrobiota bacterium]